jgi:hypothetical protein
VCDVKKQLDWVPLSAALLVTGAMALAAGALLSPSGSSTTETIRVVQDQDARWLVVASIYFVASVALTLGLPSVLYLLDGRGRVLGAASGIVLAVGFIGTAGYAMLMVFFRALVKTGSIQSGGLRDVTHENGLEVFLYGWIAAFYLGELLLAFALFRARTAPRWVPLVLLLHVLTLPLSSLLPDPVSKATILLMATGFAGIAITAVNRSTSRPGL